MNCSLSTSEEATDLPLTTVDTVENFMKTDCNDTNQTCLNHASDSDSLSSDCSSSLPSVESSRERGHLTLDIQIMKTRSDDLNDNNNGSCVVKNGVITTSADSTYSPPSMNTKTSFPNILAEVQPLLNPLTPENIQKIQNWKSALLNGVHLNSPLQSNQSLLAQLQQQQHQASLAAVNKSSNNNKTSDETPTPGALIYPKNVTQLQEAFAEGFQKVLSGVYREHGFDPSKQPTCTPSTVKYILSLLTPSIPRNSLQQENSQQQQQNIISLFHQNIPPEVLISPTLPIFNAPSLPTTSSCGKSNGTLINSSATNNFIINHSTTYVDTATLTQRTNDIKRNNISIADSAALAYHQLLLSPTTPTAAFNSGTVSTTSAESIAKAAAAVVAAVAASTNVSSPTEPQRKSPRTSASAGNNLNTTAVNIFNGVKLDPSNSRYMEFLHHQQQSIQHQVNTSFLPNFSSNPNGLQLPLNFSQSSAFLPTQQQLQNGSQLLLATSQQQQQQQQQQQLHLHDTHHSSAVSQCLPQQQQQHLLIKQENEFMHDISMQLPSTSALPALESKSPSLKRKIPYKSKKSSYSDASAGSSVDALNDYANQNNSFDEDQERKKLERKRARNRMAASKCRQRKLERITELEEQVRLYQTESAELQRDMNMLRQTVDELSEELNQHRLAGCVIPTSGF